MIAQIVLADEINRATPKTQSALLEAMAEGQVSVDGKTHELPSPFFVIATQNPGHQMGTFPLPESQLDRFLMSLSLGYPDEASEKRMLTIGSHKTGSKGVRSAMTVEGVLRIQALVSEIHVGELVADYAYRVVRGTRDGAMFVDGLSPRAGMAWMRAAQAWALLDGRTWVTPDDLQAVFIECAVHRLQNKSGAAMGRAQAGQALRSWLQSVPVQP